MSPSQPNFDGQSSTQIREIQELALIISAKNLNPAMLSEDFLKFSGIVPNDWELAKQPILSPNFAQVSFQNGVSIVSQPRTVSFAETIDTRGAQEPRVPQVARKYVDKLPHAEYQTLSINTKSIVPFSGGQDAARKYITGTLLAAGPWLDFGQAPVQAGINLSYQLERCQFNLGINEARVHISEQAAIPALLFAGSFNYAIAIDSEPERLKQLTQCIDEWRSDWEMFNEIIRQWFFKQGKQQFFGQMEQESLFPGN
jgi:hypothetical protein